MSAKKQRTDSLEQKRWFQTTRAILGLAVAAIAVISGLVAGWSHLPWSETKYSYENIEIVVDASAGMRQLLHGKTKQEIIAAAFKETLSKQTADRDNLALRQYSGECGGTDNTRLLVKFGQNNQDKILKALGALKLQGEAPLASAVAKATGDFPQQADSDKRIIVIAGDGGCDPNASKYIADRLPSAAGKQIKLDFRFIYLGESAEEFKKLEQVAKGTGGMAIAAETKERFDAALVLTVEVEPVLSNISDSISMLNVVAKQTEQSIAALNRKDYTAAQESLKAAHLEFDRTELLFQDFGKRQSREEFREAQQLTSQNRDIQSGILALVQRLIEQAQRNDIEGLKKSAGDYKGAKDTYNENIKKLDGIAAKLAHK